MKIAISGASGRMGKMLIETVLKHDTLQLVVALDSKDSSSLGEDCASFLGIKSGVLISDDVSKLKLADCLIDFTRPSGTLEYLQYCEQFGTKMVIGTTGFTDEQKSRIASAGSSIAIVMSSNMSYGVNVAVQLLMQAAAVLKDYDVEIVEAHHKHKVDSPSGTAIMMGEAIAHSRGQYLPDVADWSRHGHTGARKDGNIGFAVIRGGSIVGDHRVMFCGQEEVIEIAHLSSGRLSYAKGACSAAVFLKDKKTGLFDMQDVIAQK